MVRTGESGERGRHTEGSRVEIVLKKYREVQSGVPERSRRLREARVPASPRRLIESEVPANPRRMRLLGATHS